MHPGIIVSITAVITAVLVFVVLRLLDRLRKKDAESEGRRILGQARQDAANRLKEADLEIKEKALQQKTETEKEIGKLREEIRERERSLDKREGTVLQQADDLLKQERIVETTQRRAAEKLDECNQRQKELTALQDMHRQTLHQISGLSAEEATQRLLSQLTEELSQETGAILIKHQRQLAECRGREGFL